MKALMIVGVALASAMVTTGCITHPVEFVDGSIPMEQGGYTVIGDEVCGEDYQVQTFGLGLSLPGSGQRRAYKQALNQVSGAEGLVSMAVDVQRIDLPFVSFVTTRVTGTPVKLVK